MAETEVKPTPKLDNQRSPFSLSKMEILAAALAAILTWFGLRFILYYTLPFPCNEPSPPDCTYNGSWANLGHPLFSSFALPMMFILSASAIFLVRGIRKDVCYFSSIGHYALAWPLISFPLLNILSFFSLYCLPIGIGLAFIAAIKSIVTRRNWGDLIALPLSVAWFWFAFVYFDSHWWMAYGD